MSFVNVKVLNLVIRGIPSILNNLTDVNTTDILSLKPCYKRTAFNTRVRDKSIWHAC